MRTDKLDAAADFLSHVVDSGEVAAATIYVRRGHETFGKSFGAAKSEDAIFLIASITKPITAAAVMALCDQSLIDLDDPAVKFIPEFTGDGRDEITIRQLLTHVSGLPDQLPHHTELRVSHAKLCRFVDETTKTPLLFAPGSAYSYSSMAILLASEVAQRVSGKPIADLVDETVFQPLGMKRSALGIRHLDPASLIRCQVEDTVTESGSGGPATRDWDRNSDYWRNLGAPWGGAYSCAPDVARFLSAFLHPLGKLLQPSTARLMITNQNPPGIRPRGLGFDLGSQLGGPKNETTFGHAGVTGTLCWADPQSDSIFVVLTTLPLGAASPHPREVVSRYVAEAVSER